MRKKYLIARVFLYVVFFAASLFVLYLILFPETSLDFFFNSPTSQKNSLSAPYANAINNPVEEGKISANDKLIVNANPLGQFYKANVTVTLDNSKADISNTPVKIKKSFQAFRYPDGTPMGFGNTTLLTTPENAAYYIVSGEKLRKFANTDTILKFGYPKNAFLEVSKDDLKYNENGEDIVNADSYPDDTLFVVNDTYYQLKNGQLFPFVSARAFLSKFDAISAIPKDENIFATYPVSQTQLGFADGTLASSDTSVYILSGNKSYPIMNPETFLAMGFNWEDVIPATQDELSIYEKQKQFTYRMPHPDGTLFVGKATNKYFVIDNGFKRPVLSEGIKKTYAKQKPVIVDIEGADISDSCVLQKSSLESNTFSCLMDIQNLVGITGGDYQITTDFSQKANLNTFNATFSTPINWQNTRISLGLIKNRILARWQK